MCIMFWKKKEDKRVVAVKNTTLNDDMSSHMNSSNFIVEEVTPDEIDLEEVEFEEVEIDDGKVEKKEKLQKYHVSQNKDKDAKSYMMWRVRKEGSDKTIQFFDTQKIAIDFAQDLANRTGTTVVIHKLDGSIRKQDYSNKE